MSITFAQSQDEIAALVKHFRTNFIAYHAPGYKEAHARQEFINPLFIALGWDVYNTQRATPQYREVVLEDSLDVEGQTKAPDYTFRVGKDPVFFVEAKRPGIVLKTAIDAAYQVRRYAWSAKLPLSILTDFEEFAVYDCRARPAHQDKATVARTNYYTFEEYADRWREVWEVFSREAVLTGSFNQYAEANKGKRGTTTVDAEFLKEIEHWRDDLAHNFALRNPRLSIDELNDVVQRTIDRIIFLRMAEDRGSEPYERLKQLTLTTSLSPAGRGGRAASGEGDSIYAGLIDLARKADAEYNSGLFDFSKKGDQLSPTLALDDKILKHIILDLYYPNPYEFKYIPVEILGNVYEQFLGKIIRLTPSHQAKVEEKPEVKKAGGVYYTPSYIVDYIVKHTVGQWIEDHVGAASPVGATSPVGAASPVGADPRVGPSASPSSGKHASLPLPPAFRVLDMACGSGSFLLGAYQFLLDYYLKWYVEHLTPGPSPTRRGERSPIALIGRGVGGEGEWRLTIAEKKRILTAHIFGVDIDRQAVEVTKLSLLLKVLEGENDETLQMRLFDEAAERALPNLDQNIKCGNSLIGQDYFADQLLPDAEELRRVNPFDWQKEFPDAMKAGGFDCIIGNPPYVRSINLKESDPFLWNLYRSRYHVASSREWDIYLIFVEKGLSLLEADGELGFILPNKFLNSQVGENLRGTLAKGKHLERLIHFGAFQVFQNATTYTCLLFLDKAPQDRSKVARYIGSVSKSSSQCPLPEEAPDLWKISDVANSNLTAAAWEFSASDGALLEKLKRWPPLETVAQVFQGTGTRADKVYLLERKESKGKLIRVYSHEKEKEYLLEPVYLKPALRGRSIKRYAIDDQELLLLVPYEISNGKSVLVPEKKLASLAPRTLDYLRECEPRLNERENGRFKGIGWYCYGRPQNLDRFEVPAKIVLPDVANRGSCYLDRHGKWLLDTAYAIALDPGTQINLSFIVAILNSPLLTYFLKETGTALRGGYFRMKTAYLNPFPIRTIDFNNAQDKAAHDRMVELVDTMLQLHPRLSAAQTAHDREMIQRQIDATDKQIDALVYQLYGLKDEEIKIVEG